MTTCVLPSEVRHGNALACAALLKSEIGKRGGSTSQVVVDAAAVTRFDSSAIAVLLEARREALAQGRSFVVNGLPDDMRRLAQVYGVRELLTA
jgi:phospholipid transport system transporter-binding protein